MTDLYRIVVPSRRRTEKLSPILTHMAHVTYCVAEPELDDYSAVLPKGIEVMTHPSLQTIGAIRQYILDQRPEKVIVQSDDDLRHVMPLVGTKRKKIIDPQAVQRIIENCVHGVLDLNLGMFCFSRQPKPNFFRGHKPFNLVAPCAACFGIADRRLAFDPELFNAEDVDITMKSLLLNRIVLQDYRFYFDYGLIGSGVGGLQGKRSDANVLAGTQRVSDRWSGYVALDGETFNSQMDGCVSRSRSMGIRVGRTQTGM